MATPARDLWIDTLLRIANPVFKALAVGQLRGRMSVESAPGAVRQPYTRLEAVGRSLTGLAPWLELGDTSPEEAIPQGQLRKLVQQGLPKLVDPDSPDCLSFTAGPQSLVDSAFLAQGLLRAWNSVWLGLGERARDGIVAGMEATRAFTAPDCNWLLFPAMIETFLEKAGRLWKAEIIDKAFRCHVSWYKGDGLYGDGPELHVDYYNSFVIQPMLFEIVHQPGEIGERWKAHAGPITHRARRYAAILERMIGPDGRFPPLGRSLTYRFGVFQHLGLMALRHNLPEEPSPGAVRAAMTEAMLRLHEAKDTFDDDGWLRIGLRGHQPSLGERYISTGSLYLTLTGFLPLGLPDSDPFWSDPDRPWTSRRIWQGEDLPADHALLEPET